MFSRLHEAILRKRVELYKSGAFRSFSLGAFAVGVGNLTVGGTGKTPLVAVCAEILSAQGEKVCVISRGYKRENPKKRILVSDGARIFADARQAGDEPRELAEKLFGKSVVVIADADRVSAAKWARARFGATAFVLDDAYQHLRARRDFNILVIDAANPFGNRRLLPFGILREPLQNLNRADAVVVTRANLGKNVADLKAEIRKYNHACPIFVTSNEISRLTEIAEFGARSANVAENAKIDVSNLKRKYLAFCGLGNPNNFFAQLRGENFDLVSTETFRDHYFYRQADVLKIERKARETGADALLTTPKDAVKLKDLKFELPCFVAESTMIFEDANGFSRLLVEKLEESKVQNSV